jgi:NAD-dependent dihydropyrimidine dehydrogenase PreA subunit
VVNGALRSKSKAEQGQEQGQEQEQEQEQGQEQEQEQERGAWIQAPPVDCFELGHGDHFYIHPDQAEALSAQCPES